MGQFPRGSQREEKSSQTANNQEGEENPPVGGKIEFGKIRRHAGTRVDKGREKICRPNRDQKTGGAAQQCQEESLSKQLAQDATAAGTEGQSDRNFFSARCAT